MNGSIILDEDIPSGSLIKNLLANVRDISSPPGLEDFWRRKWQSTAVLLPGKSHGQKKLVGCTLWGRRSVRCHFVTKC